jgi:methionine-rich copper-binding protein CopC
MQTTIVPGIMTWSRWQPDRAMFFNAWLVQTDAGHLAVDPLEPDADDLAQMDALPMYAVVVTNRDHERAAAVLAARYGIPVFAPEPDADEMQVPVARRLRDGDDVAGWRVVMFDGFKTPGEFALVRGRVAITGDAFWGVPAGALRLMPDEKLADPAQAALSARRLLEANVQHLLVGDGMPVYHRAFDALAAMLDARPGVFVRRVNIDEGDACFYPDSNKVLVDATDTLVRSAPELDYFDGELP